MLGYVMSEIPIRCLSGDVKVFGYLPVGFREEIQMETYIWQSLIYSWYLSTEMGKITKRTSVKK